MTGYCELCNKPRFIKCGEFWGARYRLGARYRSENTVNPFITICNYLR